MGRKKKVGVRKQRARMAELLKGQAEMRLPDLQRNNIARGRDFQEVVEDSIPGLSSWLQRNWNIEPNPDLIDDYDDWYDKQLNPKRFTVPRHASLRLGFIAETDEETGEVTKRKRVKGMKKKKKKRSKNTKFGIYTGTKKELVFQCVEKGFGKDKTIRKVTRKFPDANPKSIGIWYNKAKKQMK